MKKLWVALILLLPTLIISQTSGPNANEQSWDNDPVLELQNTDRDSLLALQEKVLLHLSDNMVQNRGTIFFKAYLVTGPKRFRYDLSKVLRLELVDQNGAVVKRQYHPLNDGVASGNLIIPKKINGKYYIKAYTRWMQNYGEAYYAKNVVYVGNPKNQMASVDKASHDVNIFPEGGKLINGLRSRIVVQIDKGETKIKSGSITDSYGTSVAEITSYSGDLFTAAFTPETGEEYQLLLDDGRTYPLPVAKNQGYLLQVNNLHPDKARVRVMTSEPLNNKELKLIGELDGIQYLDRELEFESESNTDFEFSKIGIPRGVMMLKLVDDLENELAERPVWIDGNEVNIEIVPLVGEQTQENEFIYQIQVTDRNNNPVQAELALGVREDRRNSIELEKIDGTAGFDFFDVTGKSGTSKDLADDRRERFLKDIRLLSEISDRKQDLSPDKGDLDQIKYPFQKGLELAGYAYDLDNNLLAKTDIQLMAMSEGQIWFQELKTDSKGRLFLKNLDFEGESELVFRTKGESTVSRLVKVVPDATSFEAKGKALSKKIKKQEKERVYTPDEWEDEEIEGLIDLAEVVIEEKPVRSDALPSVYGVEPDHVRYQDPSRLKTIPQMLMDIPGVIISGIGDLSPTVRILGAVGPILWVVDGMPLAQATPFASASLGGQQISSLAEIMSIVPASSVERIELLKSGNAAIYGSRAQGGVFLIYTRLGSEVSRAERKEAQLVFQGYEPEMDFEEYRQKQLKKSRSASNTLYWNPSIQTDENGKATVRFVVPDKEKSLQVQLSTVTKDGKLGVYDGLISN